MRGRDKEQKTLTLTGKSYLVYIDDEAMEEAQTGDLCFYVTGKIIFNDEAKYYKQGYKGSLKAEVFDGKQWCLLDMEDIFQNGEQNFNKNDLSINTYHNCEEIVEGLAGTILYRTYRNHYSTQKYQRTGYKGKKSEKYMSQFIIAEDTED